MFDIINPFNDQTRLGYVIKIILMSSETLTTSNAALRSRLAIATNSSLSRALEIIDCIAIAAVTVLSSFLKIIIRSRLKNKD